MTVYNVKDFGAVGNGATLDKAAIQAALDAAYNAGGGDVYIPTGVYLVTGNTSGSSSGALLIRDNVNVYGDGMGQTVIKVADGWDGKITGVMRTPYGEGTENASVRDLTLDGNRANTTGKVDGWFNGYAPGQVGQDTNITLDRMEILNMSGYGFDPHEQTYNLVIQNSVSHGNGLDGFVADYIRGNSVYANNLAYGNDRHGFNIVTSSADLLLLNNIGRDNAGGGVVIQRGTEDIELVSDIHIQGGEFYGNAKEGIQINKSDGVTITGTSIHNNGTNGIRVYGSTDVVVDGNSIFNNSQSKNNGYSEIRFQDYDETAGVSGLFFDSNGNVVKNNTIFSNSAIHSTYGIEEFSGKVTDNLFYNNSISGTSKGTIFIVGADSHASTPDMLGSAGSDYLLGNGSINLVDAGAGNDTVSADDGNDTIYGGAGADSILGGNGNDLILGGSENDSIYGGAGNDIILSGTGNDNVQGETGNDFLNGGFGNDTVNGGAGADTLEGWYGNDNLNGGADNDTLSGGEGRDTLTGGTGADVFKFLALSHSVSTGGMTDRITDFDVNLDKINVNGLGFSTLTSNATTAAGELRIFYNAGSNATFVKSDQSDFTFALDGNFLGSLSNNNFYFTTPVSLVLTGSAANDTLVGTNQNELLLGMEGNDSMNAGAGNDTLDGGLGRDTMTGGLGADVFRYAGLADSSLAVFDRITDFEIGVDKLDVSTLGFSGLDTDGGKTEAGELRFAYSSTSNVTYIRSDLVDFQIALSGDYRGTLTNNDFILSAPPPPSTTGTAGNDTLLGGSGSELMQGLDGHDSINGGDGNDTLAGGLGRDTLVGGTGADIFTFYAIAETSTISSNYDRIIGFEVGVDKLNIAGLGFIGLDTDGGKTEAGELRLAYSSTTDRTYIRSDQSDFQIVLDGDYRFTMSNGDFWF